MKRTRRTLIAVLALFLIVSACGDDDAVTTTTAAATTTTSVAAATTSPGATTTEGTTPNAAGSLNSLLPDAVRDAGVIKAGGPVTVPPAVYLAEDAVTRTGYMTDLANAVGELLGVEIEYAEQPFPSLIPGLQSGAIDMTFTVSDKIDRQEVLDFVDYLADGLRILVPAGNPNGFDSLESLCGNTVAVLSGSIAVGVVTEANAACADKMEIKEFPSAADAQLAVRSGQADATFGGGTALGYISANLENGTIFEVAPGGPYTVQPDAFAFLKGNDQLRDAVQAALQVLVDNGTAAQILEKYGVDSSGLYNPIPINVVTPPVEADLNAMLPDAIREAGVLKSGGPVTVPPGIYLDTDAVTRIGFTYELATAVANELGLELEYTEQPFPSLIPGLQSGALDMTVTVSDTFARQEVLDFVDYLADGLRVLVPAGNPNGFDSLESLCGNTVAVLAGSVASGVVARANESCADPMEIKEFPAASDAQLAVRAGQADATFGTGTSLNYLAQNLEGGTIFEVAPGGPYTVQPSAFAVLKGNDQLRDAVQAALQRLISNGTAAAILEKYNVDSSGLYDPVPINVVTE